METKTTTAELHYLAGGDSRSIGRKLIIIPFRKEHVDDLDIIEHQRTELEWNGMDSLRALEKSMYSYSGVYDGRIVCCFGAMEMWKDRALIWAVFSSNTSRATLSIVREMRKGLDRLPFRRLEMDVRADVPKAIQLAFLLGFRFEAERRSFFPDGTTGFLFSRIDLWHS